MNKLRRTLPPLATLLPFEAAARLESFTQAASELDLTQAAISRQIRLLEQNLGVRLFERRNRAVFLTAAGRELGQAITPALRRIAREAERCRGEPQASHVVLFCQLCESMYWLMPRFDRFHQAHPDIEVRISASANPLSEAQEDFDVAIQTMGRASGAYPRAFAVADPVFPICSPEYASKQGTFLTPTNLAEQQLLHYYPHSSSWPSWADWLGRQGRPVRIKTKGRVFDSYPVMLQATIEGQGLALGSYRSIEKLLVTKQLMRPLSPKQAINSELVVYRHQNRSCGYATDALLSWLNQELRSKPDPAL